MPNIDNTSTDVTESSAPSENDQRRVRIRLRCQAAMLGEAIRRLNQDSNVG